MVTIGNANTPAEIRRKWTKICRCSVGWHVVGILAIIVGILFMAFFVKYWNNTQRWERGLGYFGLALFLFGILVTGVGIFLACILCYIVRRAKSRKPFVPPKKYGAAGLYPRQPPSTEPSTQPTAPVDEEGGEDNKGVDVEAVEPEVKDKTF